MAASEKFRVGITPDFPGEREEILGPAVRELFDPLPGLEYDFMEDTGGVARPDVIDRYHAMLVFGYAYPAESLRGVKKLACLARWGVGYDKIDVAACNENDVAIAITPNGVRRPVAEGDIAFIFSLAKNMREWDLRVREGRWRANMTSRGICIQGRTLGSIGLGNIAGEMFRITRHMGFGRLIACDPYAPAERAQELGVELLDFDTVMRESDFLTVHTFLSESTRGLINERALSLMKPTAFLINTSRGAVIDEQALYRALTEGRIAGAGLDVFEKEPPDPDNPLFQLDNVQLSPHSISWTEEGQQALSFEACRNIRAIYEGRPPTSVANREVLERPGFQAKLTARGKIA